MAYTRITNTRDGAAAIRYAHEEPAHREGTDRVLVSSGSNLDPQFAMQQMRSVWRSHGKANGDTVQMYRVIQSFGLDELNPEDPEDIARANEIGKTLAAELYPDKQSLIVTQADGEGGKLHNHLLVNSVSFGDGKSLRGYRKEHDAVAEKTDEILVRHGMQPLDTENTRNKRTRQEKRLSEQGKYVWKDDLRDRIDEVLEDTSVTSRDTFIERMRDSLGVNVAYEDKRKYVTYSFDDPDGKQRKSRDNKLGTDYGKNSLMERFETNTELQKAEERRQQEQENNLGFDFNFEDELEAIRPGKQKTKRSRSKPIETDLMKEVRLERETEKEMERIDDAHGVALIENAHHDALRENEQWERSQAELKEKAERKEQERRRQVEQARQEQEEREQLQQQERQREQLRERALLRIQKATTPYNKVTPEFLDRFIESSGDLEGKTHATVTDKQVPYSDHDIYRHTQSKIAEEKRQDQGHNKAVEQNEVEMDAPEIG